jgi:hypothetical protein
MIELFVAGMIALTPCKHIYAIKKIWDTNEYYVQYEKDAPWFHMDEKEFRSLKCEVKNYVVIG